jgi:hypothetical protein
MLSHPEGYSTHAFLLYLGGVLLIYTHRFLLSVSGCGFTCGVFVGCGFGCGICVVLGIYYVGLVYYWVVGSIVWGCVSVLIYFITVCEIFLIVLLCILSAAYYVSCDSFRKAVPDYALVSLAVAYLFDAFFKASRAFSICICRANISSALSISRSASVGSTDIVTDVVKAGLLSTDFGGSASFIVVRLLDSGISVVFVLSVASTDRFIILLSPVVCILRG